LDNYRGQGDFLIFKESLLNFMKIRFYRQNCTSGLSRCFIFWSRLLLL